MNIMKAAAIGSFKESPKPKPAKRYRARQPSLFDSVHIEKEAGSKLKKESRKLSRRTHGGEKSKNKRKEFRPLDKNKWTHLILKSSKAKVAYNLLQPQNQIFTAKTIGNKAKKFGITIHSSINVGNHLHLKLKFRSREEFQDFLRSVTALIARFVTGARRGRPFGKFWDALAYTRVVTTRKEQLQLCGYMTANELEASTSKAAREDYLAKFNAWVESLTGG